MYDPHYWGSDSLFFIIFGDCLTAFNKIPLISKKSGSLIRFGCLKDKNDKNLTINEHHAPYRYFNSFRTGKAC